LKLEQHFIAQQEARERAPSSIIYIRRIEIILGSRLVKGKSRNFWGEKASVRGESRVFLGER